MKLIVNPIAGKGRAKKALPFIQDYLKKHDIKYSICLTRKPTEATSLAKEAVNEGCSKVVVIGGDGTINEAINGLVGNDILFGVIPVGSGNDFCMGLGIPNNLKKACDVVMNGNTRSIDVGRLNERYFVSSAGIGIDADTAYEASKNSRMKGLLLYISSLFKVLIRAKPGYYRINVDGRKFEQKGWIVAVGNCPSYGGGIKINPGAKIDDSTFDVCIIKDIAKWRVLYYLPVIVMGKHRIFKNIRFLKAKNIQIETSNAKAHIDGEIMTSDSFRFEILPKSLKVLTP